MTLLTIVVLHALAMLAATPVASAAPPPGVLIGATTWLGTYSSVELQDIAVAPDGAAYAAGKASHTTEGWDIVLMKQKVDGTAAWQRTVGSAAHGDEQAQAVAVSKAGIVVTTGRYRTSTTSWGVLTTAWTTGGRRLWVKRLAGHGGLSMGGTDVLVTAAGDIYVTGRLARTAGADHVDLFIARYSRSGRLVWKRFVGGSAAGEDSGNALARDGRGHLYVAGWLTNTDTGRDMTLVKYRPDGRRMWLRTRDAAGGRDDWLNAVAVRGGYLAAAGGHTASDLDTGTLVTRHDTTGAWRWSRVGDSIGDVRAEFTAVGVDRYCHIVAAGRKDFGTGAGHDAYVARHEPDATLDWSAFHRGTTTADDRGAGVALTAEGDVFWGGYLETVANGTECFVERRRPDGSVAWLSYHPEAAGDDGVLALTLSPQAVCLAGASGTSALMAMYHLTTP